MRRCDEGIYDHIGRVCMRGGWRFDIYDVMKTAYPWASKEKLVDYIRDYRKECFHRRGKK